MGTWTETACTAFEGSRRIAQGPLKTVAMAAKCVVDAGTEAPVLIFNDGTSAVIEVDFRGTEADLLERLAERDRTGNQAAEPPRRPGRPKLGVVAREVTLLPRHWEWLNQQPGGASVALRKLVETARKANRDQDRIREAREVCYRFMAAMAGNEPGFEEATRALFAGDQARFEARMEPWPEDVREMAARLSAGAWTASA